MASDISLAVGDGARRMTYAERTIAAHEETIRHLRGLLADERRRMLALLTGPARVPWWRRWFR
jgi:hypothetical protein